MLKTLIYKNLRLPYGIVGKLVGRWMAKNNYLESEWTVGLLNIAREDQVLEVGFGPGVAIGLAAEKSIDGQVAGVDLSPVMVKVASRRNSRAISKGKVDLRLGDVSSLPYPDNSFDKAFAIHCIYFWSDPVGCLQEIHRVVKPGGIFALTIRPRDRWAEEDIPSHDLFTLYSTAEVEVLLQDTGFFETTIHQYTQLKDYPNECITGVK